MKPEDFKDKEVKDQYGTKVTVVEIVGSTAKTTGGLYHIEKIFYEGKSVYRHLNKRKKDEE